MASVGGVFSVPDDGTRIPRPLLVFVALVTLAGFAIAAIAFANPDGWSD